MTCATCNLQISGLHERIEQLEAELAAVRSARERAEGETAILRVKIAAAESELSSFAIAVDKELGQRQTLNDDVVTAGGKPRNARSSEHETVRLPNKHETMADVVNRGLR